MIKDGDTMPMCSDPDAKCRAVHTLIRDMGRCPFEFPSGYCDGCDECESEKELVWIPYEDDEEE